MEFWQSIILGIVQGVTEFLPVSASGHLVLVYDLLHVEIKSALAFDALVHFAATLAIVAYFWRVLLNVTQTLFRKLGRLPVNAKDLILLKALAIGTVPAVVGGVILEPYIENYFQSNLTVALGLFVGALFFMYAEWKYFTRPKNVALTARSGFLIGLFQMLVLIPGLSRSGATIAGGMLLGLSRYEAARFSFLLAIPITTGVGIKKTLELISIPGEVSWLVLGAGTATAFVVGLVVIHYFLGFVRRYTLWPFIWYSLVIAALIVYSELFT